MEAQELAFDLRQKYAEIVGLHLEDCTVNRKEKKYLDWFNSLEDLYTVTSHKFKTKIVKATNGFKLPDELKKEKGLTPQEKYNIIRAKIIEVSNKYKATWLGQSKNSSEQAEIEKYLRLLEQYFYYIMDEAKLFGSKWEDDGL